MSFGLSFGYILIGLAVLGFIFCLWSLWCNNVTYNQRTKASKIVFSKRGSDFDRLYIAYDRVSYHQHMWYLQTFRNPRKLYPSELHWK